MKPSTVLGTSFIGLALALVGLNAFMPTWPALNKTGTDTSITQAATPPDGAGAAKSPLLAENIPAAAAPPAAEVRRKPAPVIRIARRAQVRTAPRPAQAAPRPRPTPPPASAPNRVNVRRNTPRRRAAQVRQARIVVRKAAPVRLRVAVPAPVLAMVPVPVARPEPVVAEPPRNRPAALTSSPELTQLQHKAQLDFIRRTAMGLAKRGKPGTSIVSADVDDLHHGNYRAVLVENGPRGTLVESMYFKPANRGGSFLAARHVLSSSVSDPAADAWTPSQ